jgi:hypothetical protein
MKPMSDESELPRQQLRTEACRLAAAIRRIEEVIPNLFGDAAAVVRLQAASDDIALDDLTTALGYVRLALWVAEIGPDMDTTRKRPRGPLAPSDKAISATREQVFTTTKRELPPPSTAFRT